MAALTRDSEVGVQVTMRPTRFALVLVFAVAPSVAAQLKPDFTGVWTLSAASNVNPPASSPNRRVDATELHVKFETAGPFPVMVVEHRSLGATRVEQHRIGVTGGVVGGVVEGQQTEPARSFTSAMWQGASLVIRSSEYSGAAVGSAPFYEHEEVWSLESPDRLVLRVTDRSSAAGTQRRSLVYTPKSP